MKSRVVILSAFATPFRSGAEAMVEEVSALLQKDYDITVVTARLHRDLPKEDRLESGVRLVRVGFGSSLDKWLFPFLGALEARRLKPQIIHAVLESFAGLALIFCTFLAPKSRKILTCQSTNTTFLLKAMHRSADVVTVISTVLLKRAASLGRKDAVLIPNGLQVKIFEDARSHVRKIPGRILFVGRLESMKGVDTLLKAFAIAISPIPPPLPPPSFASGLRMDKRGEGEDAMHLRIVGDGSQRQALEQLAKSLKIADRVTFVGRVAPENIAEEYAAAEIFCGLSRSEALGNVFLEAQAAGCAVVATKVGGIPDSVKDGETGLLVQPDSPKEASDVLCRLLQDSTLLYKLSHAAIAHAAGYDWQGIAPQYAKVYQELLG